MIISASVPCSTPPAALATPNRPTAAASHPRGAPDAGKRTRMRDRHRAWGVFAAGRATSGSAAARLTAGAVSTIRAIDPPERLRLSYRLRLSGDERTLAGETRELVSGRSESVTL